MFEKGMRKVFMGAALLGASAVSAAEVVPLKDVFPFKVGAAVNYKLFAEPSADQEAIVSGTFSSITPENDLKPMFLQPEEGKFNFEVADKYVAFGEKHKMKIIGHTLVWHEQTPGWFFTGPDGKPASRELLIERMRRHIHTVVGRYKGRIHGWDVVNEALEWDGTIRHTKWRDLIGEDFLDLAFQFAHEADPNAELYYNDYQLETDPKRSAAVKLVRRLKRKGIRIDGVGIQCHGGLGGPDLKEFEKSILALGDCGVKVCVTELDVSVLPSTWGQSADITKRVDYDEKFNPYKDGKLPLEKQKELAQRYCDLFALFMRHADVMDRVTVWGVFDWQSWFNDWPTPGRTDYPLFYDRAEKPKLCAKELYKFGKAKSVKVEPRTSFDRTAKFMNYGYRGEDKLLECDEKTQYRNPIVDGMGPDPAITRKGDDFYLAQSCFSYYPGVPVWHSKNLVDWDFCGYVIDRPSQVNLYNGIDLNNGIYAPDIKYNPYNDTFYMIVVVVGDACRIYKTKDPYQGWSEAIKVDVPGIDPGIYFEDDKIAYIVNNQDPENPAEYNGHKAIWLRKYDLVNDKLVEGYAKQLTEKGIHPEEQPIWCEGPHLYKINGFYYLMTAEGGTAYMHSEVAWRAEKIEGPYHPCKGQNPILTQRNLEYVRPNAITCTGHADLLYTGKGDPTTKEGFSKDGWYAVFLGVKPYSPPNAWNQLCNTGRNTFIVPVTWEGEGDELTPVILKDKVPVPVVAKRTGVQLRKAGDNVRKTAGNVSFTDEFDSPQLDPLWIQVRNPDSEWFYVTEGQKGMNVVPRTDSIYSRGNPSYVCRWLKNSDFSVETTLRFKPAKSNEIAGLALYQNENWNYVLGKTLDGKGGTVLVLRKCEGGRKEQVVMTAVPADEDVALRCVGRGAVLKFYYRLAGDEDWRSIAGEMDGTVLSTERAGGFVGASVGLYACSEEAEFPMTTKYSGADKVTKRLDLVAGASLEELEIGESGCVVLEGADVGMAALTVAELKVPAGVNPADRVFIGTGKRSRTVCKMVDGRWEFSAEAADENTPVRTVWKPGAYNSFTNSEGFFDHWMQGMPTAIDTIVYIGNAESYVWNSEAFTFAAIELLGDAEVKFGPDQTWKYPGLNVNAVRGKGVFTLYRCGLMAPAAGGDCVVDKGVKIVVDNDGINDSWMQSNGSGSVIVNGPVTVKQLLIVRKGVVFNGDVTVEQGGEIREEAECAYNGKVVRK